MLYGLSQKYVYHTRYTKKNAQHGLHTGEEERHGNKIPEACQHTLEKNQQLVGR